MKVALAPVMTDGPLLIGAALLASRISGIDAALGAIGLVGAGFLLFLAWESWGATEVSLEAEPGDAGSVMRAILTNLLNPHPYVFWVAIGGPLVADAWVDGPVSTAGFLVGFFGCLCGSKIGLAWAVGANRKRIGGAGYVWTMRALAVALVVFAGLFAFDAMNRLAG